MNSRADATEVKEAARGRWPQILRSLAPKLSEAIDAGPNRKVCCPLPEHDDQDPSFRFDDQGEGKAICTCSSYDGIGLLRKANGWDFRTTMRQIAQFLGIECNGKPVDHDILLEVASLKRISVDSLRAYGGKSTCRNDCPCVRIPVYNEKGEAHSHFDLGVKTDMLKKGMFRAGKGSAGLFFPGRLPKSGEEWILPEGVKDGCAYYALDYLACGLNTDQMAAKYTRLFRGVNVIIMPDRTVDAEEKAKKTAGKLHGVAASVRVGTLPLEIGGDKGDDVRDVLRLADGEKLLRQAIDDAVEWQPGADEELALQINADGLTKVLADAICQNDHFARDGGGKLYRFRDGAYRAQAERYVKAKIKKLLEEWEHTKEWSPRQADAVVEYISIDAPELWERPLLEVINVANGLLRVSDQQLLPHSPDHLSCVQLPAKYDPAATCPEIEQFVSDVFPPDATELAYEIPANLMRPDTAIQKAVLLIGPGGNGKSVYLRLVTAFIGKSNTCGVSLYKLEADKFAGSRLYGKLANICPDLPTEHLAGTSIFKAITGGDVLTGEYKFKDSFDFVPFARLVFSANNPPRSQDSSQGFFDRWLVIPFERSFRGTDNEVPGNVLDERLQSPGELSGLLNKALDALERIGGTCGFSQPESVQAAWSDFHASTDPLAVWLDQYTVEDPDAFVVRKQLRVAFNGHLERHGRPAMSETAFGLAFPKLRPNVECKRRVVADRQEHCYIGIGLVHSDWDDDFAGHSCQGSQGIPSINQSQASAKSQQGEVCSGGEQRRANPGKGGNHDTNGHCESGGAHTWLDTAESDGSTRRFCTTCCKFGGYVAPDGTVCQTLEEAGG